MKLKNPAEPKSSQANRRQIDRELDRLEAKIEELRVLFEQHFVDVLPQPPTKLQREVVVHMRTLLKAPFKTSAARFRLRNLITRYQTYNTYWERVNKQREEGNYVKDVFKADMRQKEAEDLRRDATAAGRAEKGIKTLYDTYEKALKKSGASTDSMNYDAFKRSLITRAKQMREQKGVKNIKYKVVLRDGRVVIKAQAS